MWRSPSRKVSSRTPSKKSPSSGPDFVHLDLPSCCNGKACVSLFLETPCVSNPGHEFLMRLIVLQQVCLWSTKCQIREIVCAPTGDWHLMVNMGSHEVQNRTGIKTTAILIFKQHLSNRRIERHASSSRAPSGRFCLFRSWIDGSPLANSLTLARFAGRFISARGHRKLAYRQMSVALRACFHGLPRPSA